MNQDHPSITVVTPSLNAQDTIERTLRSIEMQEYPNLQLVCVDGNSSDATVDIIQQYSHLVSRLIREPDNNAAEAINKGFRVAEGEILCYLNADDAFAPGALKRIAELFVQHQDVDVITGGCRRVYADGSEVITQVPEDFLDVLSMRNGIEQPSTFWRASIHRRAGEFDEHYTLAFDWEWWNRLKTHGARFMRIEDVLSIYYFTDSNLTSQGGERIIEEMYRVTKQYGPFRGYVADLYMFLFRAFDMRGFYDQPFHEMSWHRRMLFGSVLWPLVQIFGKQIVNAYNWNWASKQIRGVTWYKS